MLAIIALVVGAAAFVEGGSLAPEPSTAAAGVTVPHLGAPEDPLTVLHDWDRRRSAAWATGDAAALRALYASGSVAARRDVRLLRGYLDRGLRVEGLTTQVLDAEVLSLSARRLVVSVTDRVVGGVAIGPGSATALPRGAPVSRRVTLVRGGRGWVVAAVHERLPAGGSG